MRLSDHFFGKAGAGAFIMALDTGRFLALKRSENVQQPRTWGIPGGKIDDGETPLNTAFREFREETGYSREPTDFRTLKTFFSSDRKFQFHNFLFTVPSEFYPSLDHENESFQWVSINEWPKPAHFGLETVLKDNNLSEIIAVAVKKQRPNAYTRQSELIDNVPLLYHLIHGDIKGDAIYPSQANNRDPYPYIYATTNPREALPYMTPNGTRILNATIPGTDHVITIIPDREHFLKNGRMQGTLFRFKGQGFSRQMIDNEYTTQWVSKNNLPIQETEVYAKLNGIEDAMNMGLQILFTKDSTSTNIVQKTLLEASESSFFKHIDDFISDGSLIHENQRQNVKPCHVSVRMNPEPL